MGILCVYIYILYSNYTYVGRNCATCSRHDQQSSIASKCLPSLSLSHLFYVLEGRKRKVVTSLVVVSSLLSTTCRQEERARGKNVMSVWFSLYLFLCFFNLLLLALSLLLIQFSFCCSSCSCFHMARLDSKFLFCCEQALTVCSSKLVPPLQLSFRLQVLPGLCPGRRGTLESLPRKSDWSLPLANKTRNKPVTSATSARGFLPESSPSAAEHGCASALPQG